jgi:hypothetical protein
VDQFVQQGQDFALLVERKPADPDAVVIIHAKKKGPVDAAPTPSISL